MSKKPVIEINEGFKQALAVMEESSKHVFVTGRAGTGKSTLLEYFRAHTKKTIAVLAPTGVAAVNVSGQTIHSFFRLKPNATPADVKRASGKLLRLYKSLDAIVVDEVSMVRADLLDCMDAFLRLNGKRRNEPFGGVQVIFIGDLYQLPPVVTGVERALFQRVYAGPYFFNAKVMETLPMEFVELEKVYRQSDSTFIDLLNSIRNNSAGENELAALNRRSDPTFTPARGAFFIHLTTTNDIADRVNAEHLEQLRVKPFQSDGRISGSFERSALPTAERLMLKVGSQVMLLNNERTGRWVNGTIGKIISIQEENGADSPTLVVALSDGDTVEVKPHTWEMFRYAFDEHAGAVVSEVVGSFTQYPVRLAWAVTIHKAQGKTFDRVVIDLGRGTFAHGQSYVALSRSRTLEGIVLKRPILKRDIIMDWNVVRFVTKYQYKLSERDTPFGDKMELIKQAIAKRLPLSITYLKSDDKKSRRVIEPAKVGEMEYEGKPFIGVKAYCRLRCDTRVFRVDRILELSAVPA